MADDVTFNLGDRVRINAPSQDKFHGQFATVIDQTDSRIWLDTEWPSCPKGGLTTPGNVWIWLDVPVKNDGDIQTRHSWQFSDRALELIEAWQQPQSPAEIEAYLNG